jgi:hypothetical protein
MQRHSGAPSHIDCCRCVHRIVPISGKPEIGCGEPMPTAEGYGFRARGQAPAPRNDDLLFVDGTTQMIDFIESD